MKFLRQFLIGAALFVGLFNLEVRAQHLRVKIDSVALFDPHRNRAVPVITYFSETLPAKPRLALLNHGYGGKNKDYSFLARALVARGYFVASIQHELPGDEPIAMTGKLSETRRPNWQRGVENMRFVLAELKQRNPRLTDKNLLLLGHSNGGDMVMLFAQQYPGQVAYVVSLDNRRMPLPRTRSPRVLTFRSSDQPADPGVLPTPDEQKKYDIRVIQLTNTLHNDLWDGATEQQKQAILEPLLAFLKP